MTNQEEGTLRNKTKPKTTRRKNLSQFVEGITE